VYLHSIHDFLREGDEVLALPVLDEAQAVQSREDIFLLLSYIMYF
jgi:hypothetical protein